MKIARFVVVLILLAGIATSCTDTLDEFIVVKTDPADKPGGNGGSGGNGSGGSGGN